MKVGFHESRLWSEPRLIFMKIHENIFMNVHRIKPWRKKTDSWFILIGLDTNKNNNAKLTKHQIFTG